MAPTSPGRFDRGTFDVATIVDLEEATTRGCSLPQGGHIEAPARRRGQRACRFEMLRRFGGVCAFFEEQPPQVLEAAHLHSDASVGQHRRDGGLLLRRDYHSLFDAKRLAVNPSTPKVEVASRWCDYSSYRRPEGVGLHLRPSERPSLDLLRDHHEQAMRVFSQD